MAIFTSVPEVEKPAVKSRAEQSLVASLLDADIGILAGYINQELKDYDAGSVALQDLSIVRDNIQTAIEDNGGISDEAVDVYVLSVESALFRLGMNLSRQSAVLATIESAAIRNKPGNSIIFSFEEADNSDDSSGDGFLKKVWKTIVKFFHDLVEKIKGLFGKTKEAAEAGLERIESINDDIEELEKRIEKTTEAEATKKEITGSLSKQFEIDGKATPETLQKILSNASDYCRFAAAAAKAINQLYDDYERAAPALKDKAKAADTLADLKKSTENIRASFTDACRAFREKGKSKPGEEGVFHSSYGPLSRNKYVVVETKHRGNHFAVSFKAQESKVEERFSTFTLDEIKKSTAALKLTIEDLLTFTKETIDAESFQKKVDSISNAVLSSTDSGESEPSGNTKDAEKELRDSITAYNSAYAAMVTQGAFAVNDTISTAFKVINACLDAYKGKSSESHDDKNK